MCVNDQMDGISLPPALMTNLVCFRITIETQVLVAQ